MKMAVFQTSSFIKQVNKTNTCKHGVWEFCNIRDCEIVRYMPA